MGKLYERTDIYDLFDSEARREAYKRHWAVLLEGREIASVLDVSIGTGNLSLPLLDLGVEVTGSDLSWEMLDKCREKAKKKGKEIPLIQSDFRTVSQMIHQTFDCVASTGNSLPYVKNEEVLQVLEEMDRLIRPGGYLYFDTRNWDKIRKEHQRFYIYNPVWKKDTRVNIMQVWDYEQDGSMIFHLLYTFEKENRIEQEEHFEEHYFPVSRDLLLAKLKEMNYQNIELLAHPAYVTAVDLEKADWYTVIAQKSC